MEQRHCSCGCSCAGEMACASCVRPGQRPVLIVFDLDGTLVESRDMARICYQRVFEMMGFGTISDELAESFNGPDADEICRIMGVGPERRALYDQLVAEVSAELVGSVSTLIPGVEQMLRAVAPYAMLAVLTNGSPSYCQRNLEVFGLKPYFPKASGFVSGVTKAQRIRMWAQELDARRVIVVGDRCTDVSNAREAGALAVGVTYGLGSREELADADILCSTCAQLTNVCLEWIARP